MKQDEIKRIVTFCARMGISVIPELPTLTHCDYFLYSHHDLAERQEDRFAEHYCPSNEEVYTLLFDLLDEIIDVFHPSVINIGHDELYTVCLCERCRKREAAELYAEDIDRIHTYLNDKNFRTAMWADKLYPSITKKGTAFGGSELKMEYLPEEGGGLLQCLRFGVQWNYYRKISCSFIGTIFSGRPRKIILKLWGSNMCLQI